MKAFSKSKKHYAMLIALVTSLLLAGSISAFAVPPGQVARSLVIQTFNAQCCVPIGPTVRVTQPATVTPVIVTWSTDYAVSGTSLFALSVNGGMCKLYGAGVAPLYALNAASVSIFENASYQWVVNPTDGLAKGPNSFTLCAGGVGAPTTIEIGSSTLAVQISK
jgi:hypothetical protein